MVSGTPCYLSPELNYKDKITNKEEKDKYKTDLFLNDSYALGLLIIKLLLGK